jgi:hypothetical protein
MYLGKQLPGLQHNIVDLGMIDRHVVGKAKAADDGNPVTKRLVSQQPGAYRRCRN